jgi:hypothetical protein
MLDAQVQQVAASDIVVAESVAKEQAAEDDYRDDRGEAEQTEPVSSERGAHAVQVGVLPFGSGRLNISIASEDGPGVAGISSLRKRE